VVLWTIACWDCRLESRWGHSCLSLVSFACSTGTGPCVRLITRPEESYRLRCVWLWSWSVDNENVLTHQRPLRHKKKESIIHELAHNKQECIAKSIRSVLCSKIRCSIPDNRKSLNNYAILPQFLPFMLMTVVRIVGNSLCRVIFTCLTYFNILKKPHIVTDGISCNFRNKQWPFD